jgi:hypothetical protein
MDNVVMDMAGRNERVTPFKKFTEDGHAYRTMGMRPEDGFAREGREVMEQLDELKKQLRDAYRCS